MFDRSQLAAGLLLYGLVVGLPTVHLLAGEQGLENAFLERAVVGVGAAFAGGLAWKGFRGPDLRPRAPSYWGVTWVPLVCGAFLLYLAWYTNFPHWVTGESHVRVLVARASEVAPGGLLPRAANGVLTWLGQRLLIRGMRTTKTPQERLAVRQARKQRRRGSPRDSAG